MKLSTHNNRSLPSGGLGSSATAGILRRILTLVVFTLPFLLGSLAHATLLWDSDPATQGLTQFNSLQPVNGTITVIDDPKGQFGKVIKLLCHDNGNTKARCEVSGMKGFTLSNTGDYYIGWRSMWGPLPTLSGKWQVLSQIHLAGTASAGAPVPFGLSVPGDGMMHFKYERPPDGSDNFSLWDHSFPIGSWHSFVLHIQFSTSENTGYMEFWYDGVMQTMTNGKTRIPCAMAFPGCTSYFKWGVYRSGSGGPIGDSYAYLWRPRLGTAYADVDPLGGSGIPQASAPAFSPAGGTYSSAQNVTITSATSGASIRYTTDSSTPTSTSGTIYSGPVSLSKTTTLKAIAYESGFTDSAVTSATYTITTTPPPTLNFEAESLSPTGTGATVSISNDANASGGVVEFLNSTAAGQIMTFTTPSIAAGTYQVQLRYKTNTTRGEHTVKIDGTQVGGTINQYATTSAYTTATLGTVTFSSAGTHTIALTVTGKVSASTQFYITADKFTFVGQ